MAERGIRKGIIKKAGAEYFIKERVGLQISNITKRLRKIELNFKTTITLFFRRLSMTLFQD